MATNLTHELNVSGLNIFFYRLRPHWIPTKNRLVKVGFQKA